MFLHDWIFSPISRMNMLSLFFIGILVERIFGSGRFTIIYFASGIIAGLTQMLIVPVGGSSARRRHRGHLRRVRRGAAVASPGAGSRRELAHWALAVLAGPQRLFLHQRSEYRRLAHLGGLSRDPSWRDHDLDGRQRAGAGGSY